MRKILLLFPALTLCYAIAQAQPAFTENKGQWHPNVQYRLELPAGMFFAEKDAFTYTFYNENDFRKSSAHHGETGHYRADTIHFHAYKVKFVNCLPTTPQASEKCSDYVNYFVGNDKSKWASKVGRYTRVDYSEIYPKTDLSLYFNEEKSLKYDFVVRPGGNPEDIRLSYIGQDKLIVTEDGSLKIVTSVNVVDELKPYAYQEINGIRVEVPCSFMVRNGFVAFNLPEDFNHDYALVIDPVLVFSTYSGSTADNWGFTATFDNELNVFSGGICFNIGYPVSPGAFQVNYNGGEPYSSSWYQYGCDIAIIKYTADGTQRIYATYLGGAVSEDMPHSLVINPLNDLIIYGVTGSSDFPMGPTPYDNTFNGGTNIIYDNVIRFTWGTDIIVSRLSSDGTQLLGSTFVGGSGNDGMNFRDSYNSIIMHGNGALYYNYADGARGEVITDDAGNIYVGSTTFSTNFPVTPGTIQQSNMGNQEGVFFKLNPNLSTLYWSSYFGGSNDDAIFSLDIDDNNDVYIAGGTNSVNIQTTGGVMNPLAPGGSADGFVAHINSSGTSLIKSTYIGSSEYDQVYFVRVGKTNHVYLFGQTEALGNTFIYNALYNTPSSGQFLIKLPNDLSTPVWSTAFGTGIGRPNISPTAFSVDYCNRVYLAGWGREWAGHDFYDWSTTQGTKGMDVTSNAEQPTTDGQDFYVMVLSDDASFLEYASFFGEEHYGTCGYSGHDHVDGGTSRFDKRGNIYQSVCASCGGCNGFPTHPNPGVWSPNNGNQAFNCNNAVFKFSFELPLTIAEFQAPNVCVNEPVVFNNTSTLAENYQWNFGDSNTSTDENPVHTYASPGQYLVTLIVGNPNSCNFGDTTYKYITVEELAVQTTDTMVCQNQSVIISVDATGSAPFQYHWSTTAAMTDWLNVNPLNPDLYVTPGQTTTYYVLVTTAFCEYLDSVTVYWRNANVEASPDTMVCNGTQATLSVTNLNSGDVLTYQWEPAASVVSGQGTHTVVVLPGATTTYTVSVTNQYGCTDVSQVMVEVDAFTASQGPVNGPLCHDDCNANASVYVSGVPPFDYNWSNGDTLSVALNLCPGSYSVTVHDGLGCMAVIPYNIFNPALLIASMNTLSTATCDPVTPNTGSALVIPSGGTPAYSYEWSNNDTDSLAENLYSGTYYVTVTDANLCDTVLSVTIADQSLLAIDVVSSPASCFGYCDGSANAVITFPGQPPYTYTWAGGQTVPSLTGLCAGYYTVSIVDGQYCVRIETGVVQEPDSIYAAIQSQGIACFGDSASASASVVSGGTPGFSYLWSNGQIGSLATGLTEGTHFVIVTDSHGCKDTTYLQLQEPAALAFDSTVTPVACAAACNGTILLDISGGSLPYAYDWSNGSHSGSQTGLCSGSYTVTVTDAHSCSFTMTAIVGVSTYLPQVDAQANPIIIYEGQSSQLYGMGLAALQYLWSPAGSLNSPVQQNPVASPTQNTTYTVIVEDSYGCQNLDTVTILVMDVICDEPYIFVPNAFTPNGDGNNDVLYVEADMVTDFYFAVYDRWGEKVFESDNPQAGWDGTYKGKPLDPAVFVYYLKTVCLDRMSFEKQGNITLIR